MGLKPDGLCMNFGLRPHICPQRLNFSSLILYFLDDLDKSDGVSTCTHSKVGGSLFGLQIFSKIALTDNKQMFISIFCFYLELEDAINE